MQICRFSFAGQQGFAPVGGQPLRGSRISYAYYMGRRATDARAVLMSDQQVIAGEGGGPGCLFQHWETAGNNHDKSGGNFLFCDGRRRRAGPRAVSDPSYAGVTLLNPKSQPR